MNLRQFSIVWLAIACTSVLAADDSDPRSAKVTDTAGSQTQVSGIKVSLQDERFDFHYEERGRPRIVVATKTIEFAIPVAAISVMELEGSNKWTVKYQTRDGEVSVLGRLPEGATLSGESDFGAFTLPLGKLKRLEFQQAASPLKPAKKNPVYGPGAEETRPLAADLTLTDGTSLHVSDVRRHASYGTSSTDPSWIPPRTSFYQANAHFKDFRFIRGESSQTIPFEKIKTAAFLPGELVAITTKSGAKADMKLSQDRDDTLTGLTGASSQGDAYVPLKFVKSVTFESTEK
jgi:hypothetical protein